MKNLFNLDNPFVQFLSRVGDLIIVNTLFLLCCVPVVTVGASAAALHKVSQAIILDEDNGTVKTFFRGFRENFRQATALWLMMLLFAAAMVCNWFLILGFAGGSMVLKAVVLVFSAVVLVLAAWMFPLMARYHNSLRQHANNALILAVVKLPRTVGLVALLALPAIVAVVSIQTFLTTLVFWITVGFGFIGIASAALVRPVLKELEDTSGKGVQLMK